MATSTPVVIESGQVQRLPSGSKLGGIAPGAATGEAMTQDQFGANSSQMTPSGSPTFAGLTSTGSLAVNGNTTLGDASGDSVTVNAGSLSLPSAGGLTITKTAEASTAETIFIAKVSDSLSQFKVSNSTANASEFAPSFEGVIEATKLSSALLFIATKGADDTGNPAMVFLGRYNSGSGNTDLSAATILAELRNRATPLVRFFGNGDLKLIGSAASLGYGAGAGGAVTQATSRTTGVTINKATGQITTDTTSLAAGSLATFVVTNSVVTAKDVIALSVVSGATTAQTDVKVSAVTAGGFSITVANRHASTAETGAIVIMFTVIKGATS